MTHSSNSGGDGPKDGDSGQQDDHASVPRSGGITPAPDEPATHDSDDDSGPEMGRGAADPKVVSFADLRRRQQGKDNAGPAAARPQKRRYPQIIYGGRPLDAQGKPVHPPMINLPPMVKAIVLLNIAVFAVMLLPFLPSKYDLYILFGLIPARYTGAAEFGGWTSAVAPLTHMFIHSGWLHIIMNVTMLMAFGAGVEKTYGAKRFLLFYLLCGLIGAACHVGVYPASVVPVVGASGAISGLFAAILIILQRLGAMGQGKYGLLPPIAVWIGISLLFALLNGFGVGEIAWAAHLGGFIGGFLLVRLPYFRFSGPDRPQ